MDINLEDSDDEKKKAPTRRAPSRVNRHAPRSSKPKSEQPKTLDAPKPEGDGVHVEESKPPPPPQVIVTPKSEEEVKMEIDAAKLADNKAEGEPSGQAEPMDEEKEQEEDMIVREIDVYFNPSIDPKTQLYVLQYPLRPCWRPYELDSRCEEVRIKPSNAEVEIDLSVDQDSINWEKDYNKKFKMTKETLATTWKPPNTTGYAVGVLRGNELYLNPIHAVVQMRPSLAHLKDGEPKRKTGDAEVTPKVEDVKEENSPSSSKKQRQKRTDSTDQKAEDHESWVALKYHGSSSEFSDKYLQRMVAKEDSPLQFTMNPGDYMNSLCPAVGNSDNKSKGALRKSLLELPLEERLKKLLSEEPLFHRFTALKHFAPDESVEEVLRVVQQSALLVQGLWTPKEYPSLTVKPVVKDYVLLHFSQNTVFSLEGADLPPKLREEAKRFLKIVARERPSLKNWMFKVDTDASFIKQYPDIVKKQNDIWKKIEDGLKKHFGNAKSELKKNLIPKPAVTSTITTTKTALDADGGAKQSAAAQSGEKISDETREALVKALKKASETHKVFSLPSICQTLENSAVAHRSLLKGERDSKLYEAIALGLRASQPEFLEVLNHVAVNIHGVYVLKSSPDHPEYDPLRKVVIDLLRVKQKLKKTEVYSAAQIGLKREITNNEYSKVMTELCEFKGSAWVLKSGDGSTK